MSALFATSSVRDTVLWMRLRDGFRDTDQSIIAPSLAENVASLCLQAEERIKSMPALHPQFTIHDDRHFARVTELMTLVLGDGVNALNSIELALLILSAYYHDQGMVPDIADWTKIQRSPDYLLHSELWMASHPNQLEIDRQLASSLISAGQRTTLAVKQAELLNAMKAD